MLMKLTPGREILTFDTFDTFDSFHACAPKRRMRPAHRLAECKMRQQARIPCCRESGGIGAAAQSIGAGTAHADRGAGRRDRALPTKTAQEVGLAGNRPAIMASRGVA